MMKFVYSPPKIGPVTRYLALIALLLAISHPLLAQTAHVVTSINDDGPGSLRQLITDAMDGDDITFDPSLNDQTIELTSGPIVLNKNIDIESSSQDSITVQATGAFRVIEVLSDLEVRIIGLIIKGGNVVGNGGGVFIGERTNMNLINTEISNNQATDNGGGVFISPGANVALGGVTIADNKAIGDLSPNGGGVYNSSGFAIVIDAVIRNNESTRGGGIWNTSNADMRILTSWITDNTASLEGGGIYNNGALRLATSTVSGNEAGEEAGGIRNRSGNPIVILSSTISGNEAPRAGGIVNFMGGNMSIYNSTIFGNTSDEPGAGILNEEEANISLYSSIVAANIRSGNVHSDIQDNGGGIESEGYNWIGARTTFQALPTDQVGTPDSPISPAYCPWKRTKAEGQPILPNRSV